MGFAFVENLAKQMKEMELKLSKDAMRRLLDSSFSFSDRIVLDIVPVPQKNPKHFVIKFKYVPKEKSNVA